MPDIEQVLARYPDFKVPGLKYGLHFSRGWIAPLIKECTAAQIAITSICYFNGSLDYIASEGRMKEWAWTSGSGWREYLQNCNALAQQELEGLSNNTGLVTFEYTVEENWWQAQQESLKWKPMLGPEIKAYFNGKVVIVQARLARGVRVRGQLSDERRRVLWQTTLIIMLVILVLNFLNWLMHR